MRVRDCALCMWTELWSTNSFFSCMFLHWWWMPHRNIYVGAALTAEIQKQQFTFYTDHKPCTHYALGKMADCWTGMQWIVVLNVAESLTIDIGRHEVNCNLLSTQAAIWLKHLYFKWYDGNHQWRAVAELCVLERSWMSFPGSWISAT
jgi:hypothetical protein